MNRRHFLKAAAVTGTGLTILRSGTLFGQNTPNKKLNVALIGVWGRGLAITHNDIGPPECRN